MSSFKDLIGKRFGRLVVLEIGRKNNGGHYRWKCLCDCGNYKKIISSSLVNGATKSCGCLKNELLRKRSLKHGLSRHPMYYNWNGMISRCQNKNDKSYHRYGGRGIKICKRWMKLENFIEDMSKEYKQHLKKFGSFDTSIDRIDNDGNYEPENCRWTTRKEQNRNKRSNHILTLNGETKCAAEWSEITGLSSKTIWYRNSAGWSDEKTLTTPVRIFD